MEEQPATTQTLQGCKKSLQSKRGDALELIPLTMQDQPILHQFSITGVLTGVDRCALHEGECRGILCHTQELVDNP